jgi:aryl-alcohol dehydrogenase-like predicted oxidoreductase
MLEKIRPLADAHNATISQMVINWTSRQQAIASVLVGARDEKQVTENAGALAFELTDSELEYISKLADEFVLEMQ